MSSRQDRQRAPQQRSRIASLAARLMAEDGINSAALAKRKAARSLGLPDSAAMPDDAEVEAELRTYQRLFQEDEQQARRLHLLGIAARLMTAVQRFNPYLSGSVLDGTAGRYAEIDIQLFADSAKDVEIFLLNERINYRHSPPRTDRAEAVLTLLIDDAVANLVVYPRDDERVSFKTRDGRVRERARLAAVQQLLAGNGRPAA
ncbi:MULTISPECIES: hypothetical protein [unclassified Candidatus Accumulibacter]|uniref:hypothetical protein n=1 Tax=unclassified Candidatus Accumulibacter TaxID=2619054 RepID=UPI0025BE4B09|nr:MULTISPECIES: hypothetical protein [unclassified Candidatus Accumulibacter]